ncbi:MAG: hypothetical protein GW763_06410 [Paraglaciecola sp.]|nr:hypothetical protein [Paraglaciecola sp.]NCT47617.1 hypothetical protein [Paraglaciecola sp.]
MTDTSKKIIRHLHGVMTMQEIAQKGKLLTAIREVQAWQCKRLMVSHAKMYEQARFKPAVEFFVNELYGPKDFSQRDQDIAKVVPKMAKLLPDKALHSLANAIHLNALSFECDFDLAKQLDGRSVDRDSYRRAYVASANQTARAKQITFIRQLGEDLAEVVKMRGISTLLMLSRKPAKLAGVLVLHEFIETGFKAFKQLGDVDDFVVPIVNYEQQLMLQLFDLSQDNPLPDV